MHKFDSGPIILLVLSTALPAVGAESLWQRVLRIAGISATPTQQKAPGDRLEGDVWVAGLSQPSLAAVTRGGGYRTPLLLPGDEALIALRGEAVVRVRLADGTPQVLWRIRGASRMVGMDRDDPDKVLLVLDKGGALGLGLLSLRSGRVAPLRARPSAEDRRLISYLQGQARDYDGLHLYVRRESAEGVAGVTEWSEVYLQQGTEAPRNISRCNGVSCGDPSLSPSRDRVVFIKAAGAGPVKAIDERAP